MVNKTRHCTTHLRATGWHGLGRTKMMPTFLERYMSGEHVEVWADLVTMGDRVRQEPVLGDAQAVADETMRRARQNIETLIPRLAEAGYRFGVPMIENQLEWLNHKLASPKETRGGQLYHDIKRQEKAKWEAKLKKTQTEPPLGNPRVFYPAEASAFYAEDRTATYLKLIEGRAKGPVPLSIRTWYRHVGYVSLEGAHEVLNPRGNPVADPLVIKSVDRLYAAICCALPGKPAKLGMSANDNRKAKPPRLPSIGEYSITLPNASADWQFEDEWRNTTFVNYLRKAFEWAGFPGWERDPSPPREMISRLREGLLPL